MSETEVVERLEHAVDTTPVDPNPPLEKDKYGRDASERIVELEVEDAEAVNNEVTAGKHQTYDQALHHIIARGIAEIKRTRDNAARLVEQRTLKSQRDKWSLMLQSNPSLLANNDLMKVLLKELGIAQQTK